TALLHRRRCRLSDRTCPLGYKPRHELSDRAGGQAADRKPASSQRSTYIRSQVRICAQPLCASTPSGERPECVTRTVVMPSFSDKSKRTSVSDAFTCQDGSHVKASTRGGSITRYSPLTVNGLPYPVPLISHLPPIRRSDATWVV